MSVGRRSLPAVVDREVQVHTINGYAVDPYPVVGRAPRLDTVVVPAVIPQVPACKHNKHLIIFMLDESGSVTAHNDPSRPTAGRHRETLLAIDRLGTCRCGNELAAILFFPPGTHDVGPHRLDRRGQHALRTGIANRPTATSSCMDEALDTAYDLAAAYPDHDATLVVLSDFELFDPRPDDTLQRFCRFPGHNHAVILQAPVPSALVVDPDVVVSRITWDSQPGEVAQAIVAALTVARNI